MVWFRLDSGFAAHSKVSALGDKPFRLLIECMCAVAESGSDGMIPRGVIGNRGKSINALVTAGLVEQRDGGYAVHDWDDWNGALADIARKRVVNANRQRRYRNRQRLRLVDDNHSDEM